MSANNVFYIVNLVLGSAIANSGTLTVAYPSGTAQATFTGGNAAADGVAILDDNAVLRQSASQIGLTYGGSNITLTNSSGVSWPAGTRIRLELGVAEPRTTFIQQPAIADTALANNTSTTIDAALTAIRSALRNAGIIAAS